jgi:hypothetical protein
MRLPAARLYGRDFSCLAVTSASSEDEEPLYQNWGEVNSALRESVRRRHSPIRLNQCLQTVPVEMNSRRQMLGDGLIQREKETQIYVWQVLLPLHNCRLQVGLLEQE